MAHSLFRMRILSVVILLLGVIAGFFAVGTFVPMVSGSTILAWFVRPYRLGLDLQGGTHLLYRADFSSFSGDISKSEAMAGLRDVIERRVNLFGVPEPIVQVESAGDEYRLIVDLAGV